MDERRFKLLEAQLREAVRRESGVVSTARRDLSGLHWLPIATDQASRPAVIAVVAADGGNVELRMRPFRIAFVRVGTSETEEPIGELFFSSNLDAAELALTLEREIPTCADPLIAANVDLERVCSSALRGANPMNALRELLEWGAMLAATGHKRAEPSLIVRDGMLRSIHFESDDFARIATALAAAAQRTGNRVAAVAKNVPGGTDLLNLLMSCGVFERRPSDTGLAALRVPLDAEREVFPGSFVRGRRMGSLVLVWRRGIPAMTPIEVLDDAPEAIADTVRALHDESVPFWPYPGMPADLAIAHRNAHVTPFEFDLLRRAFLDAVADEHPRLANTMLAAGLLGAGGVLADHGIV